MGVTEMVKKGSQWHIIGMQLESSCAIAPSDLCIGFGSLPRQATMAVTIPTRSNLLGLGRIGGSDKGMFVPLIGWFIASQCVEVNSYVGAIPLRCDAQVEYLGEVSRLKWNGVLSPTWTLFT
jgi:hypothetical protein